MNQLDSLYAETCLDQPIGLTRKIASDPNVAKKLDSFKRDKLLCVFFPLGFDNSVIMPKKGASVLDLKIGNTRIGRSPRCGKYLSEDFQKAAVSEYSKSTLCIKVSTLKSLFSKPRRIIRQIEGCVHATFDSLLLALPHIFSHTRRSTARSNPHSILRKVVKHIISSGVQNGYEHVISQWKIFTNYLWVKASKSETEVEPCIHKSNIFYPLFSIKEVNILLEEGIKCKKDCEILAHLVSTRQFPTGGRRAEAKAIEKFKKTVSSEHHVAERDLADLFESSISIGMRCLNYLDRKLPIDSTHISLSSSGDLETPSMEGGRGKRITDEVLSFFNVTPLETKNHKLPLGYVGNDIVGVPRWQTWFRQFRPIVPKDVKMGDLHLDGLERFPTDERRWGLDEVVGYQIYALALLRAKEWGVFDDSLDLVYDFPPLPVRTATVPEPGGKVRIVTVTLWWVIILQQPAGHFLRKCLQSHPAAVGGLTKADQAWLYLESLSRCKDFPEGFYILSSDLSEATDVIPHPVAQTLIRGFCRGLDMNDTRNIDLALVLASSDKLVTVRIKRGAELTFVKKRAIFMGEPLAKAVLTILNLAVEEEAFCTSQQCDVLPHSLPTASWRCYHVAGDDHIAIGPRKYLERISHNHRRYGSKISPEKHGMSKLAVKFCEKILYFEGKDINVPLHLIARGGADYDRSIWVDSVKVRLLSPYSRSTEQNEDSNPAIGKGYALGRSLQYLCEDSYPYWFKFMVRARFIMRMGQYLPGGKRLLHLCLPPLLGGFDLLLKGEVKMFWPLFMNLSKVMIQRASDGNLSAAELASAKSLTAVNSIRGFQFSSVFESKVKELGLLQACKVLDLPIPKEDIVSNVVRTLTSEFLNQKEKKQLLKRSGWWEARDLTDHAQRGCIFNQILSGSAKVSKFTSDPWKIRFNKLYDSINTGALQTVWDEPPDEGLITLSGRCAFGAVPIFNVGAARRLTRIIDLKSMKSVPRMLSLVDLLEKGFPSLQLPHVIGIPVIVSVDWIRSSGLPIDTYAGAYVVGGHAPLGGMTWVPEFENPSAAQILRDVNLEK